MRTPSTDNGQVLERAFVVKLTNLFSFYGLEYDAKRKLSLLVHFSRSIANAS